MWQPLTIPFRSRGGDSLIGRGLHDAYRAEGIETIRASIQI
jgi:hypothetical protein